MKLIYHKNLDGLRALAALMVMMFHFFPTIEVNTKLLQFLSKASLFGQTGVTLFFVLSGFLITRILIQTKQHNGYFKVFFMRRVLRILPLYYLYLVLVYFCFASLVFEETPSLNQQFYYYSYLQNFALTFGWDAIGPLHYWSLAVEEHFYLFWPFVILITPTKHLAKVIVCLIVLTFLLRIMLLNNELPIFFFTFTRMDSLAIGALLAVLELKQVFKPINKPKFLYLFLAIFAPTLFLLIYFTGEANYYVLLVKYTLLSFVYFALIAYALCLQTGHLLNKILASQFSSYTGKISYGLYVFHPLVYLTIDKIFFIESILINLFFKVLFTYLVAMLSFHVFEAYFLRLKRYFIIKTN